MVRNYKLMKLKGQFAENQRKATDNEPNIGLTDIVTSSHIRALADSLRAVERYWLADSSGLPPIVSAHHTRIIPKSLRVHEILKKSSTSIIGARYSRTDPICHIFTYLCSLSVIRNGIERLDQLAAIIDESPFSGTITGRQVKAMAAVRDIRSDDPRAAEKKRRQAAKLAKLGISEKQARSLLESMGDSLPKTVFLSLVVEVNVLKSFSVDEAPREVTESQVITLYDIGKSQEELLDFFGLPSIPISTSGPTAWLVTPRQYAAIVAKAPFLISMSMTDLRDLPKYSGSAAPSRLIPPIPSPGNEPIVGVIDTPFSTDVPFSQWVEVRNCLPATVGVEDKDYDHGTAVTSLIVDGPSLNPGLDDHCGRFRVRHFSAVHGQRFSSFTLMRTIASIVEANPDIHIWNLSLGSDSGIDRNFISIEAAMLDDLQSRHDIIFIISGTNNRAGDHTYPMIGPPADSINAIVVNSARFDGKPVSYTRRGPVLDFYTKPDVSAHGGDRDEMIRVWSASGPDLVCGTSFAAPWIARKMAFMVEKLELSIQEAKALLIDSAAGWNTDEKYKDFIGYGVVPIDINRILTFPEDEIRFILSGHAQMYETFTHRIPVPTNDDDKFSYTAKATLCYPSACNRNNGVDYTEDELDPHFGRLDENGDRIKEINDNRQNKDQDYSSEAASRKEFRKWDNVKIITERRDKRLIPKKKYATTPYWGLRIVKTTRLDIPPRNSIPFSVVVTFKDMKGADRLAEFRRMCDAALWEIETIDVDQRLALYEKVEEEVEFTE